MDVRDPSAGPSAKLPRPAFLLPREQVQSSSFRELPRNRFFYDFSRNASAFTRGASAKAFCTGCMEICCWYLLAGHCGTMFLVACCCLTERYAVQADFFQQRCAYSSSESEEEELVEEEDDSSVCLRCWSWRRFLAACWLSCRALSDIFSSMVRLGATSTGGSRAFCAMNLRVMSVTSPGPGPSDSQDLG